MARGWRDRFESGGPASALLRLRGVTGILALAANWDRFAVWFGYSDRYGLGRFIRRIDGKTWFVLWLSLTVVVLLERVYRLALDRDGLNTQLNKVQSDQELSDLLSDKHDYAVHELLNKPPNTQAEFQAWHGGAFFFRELS